MKKIIFVLLATVTIFVLVACNKNTTEDTKPQTIDNTNITDTTDTTEAAVTNAEETDWYKVTDNCFESKQFGIGIKFKDTWKISSNDFYPVIVFENDTDTLPIIEIMKGVEGNSFKTLVSNWEDKELGGVTYKYYLEDSTVTLVKFDDNNDTYVKIYIKEYIFIDMLNDNSFYKA